MHLLIPFAHNPSPDCQTALAGLKLPNLQQLLGQLTATVDDRGSRDSLSPPHERALASALGLAAPGAAPNDGLLPWGAWHAARAGLAAGESAWAVIHPCVWSVQTKHITMGDPAALQLTDTDSQALMAAMVPYFAQDGIHLHHDAPGRWLACGGVFRGLATASIDRVASRNVDDWLPKSAAAKSLRRLQQEMQMLLYTHALTEARAEAGKAAVNSFWMSGTGSLPSGFDAATSADAFSRVVCPSALRDAALAENWPAWADAWAQIDTTECAAALAALKNGQTVRLTLCGDAHAHSLRSPTQGGWAGLMRRFKGRASPQTLLATLDGS